MTSWFQSECFWLLYGHCDCRCNSSLDSLQLFGRHQVNEFDLFLILPWGPLLGLCWGQPRNALWHRRRGKVQQESSEGALDACLALPHFWAPAFDHVQKLISLLDGPLACPAWGGPPMTSQEMPPRGHRRSDTLQPLPLHPSAPGQREWANITASVHLLSQSLYRISWIFQAAKAASQMAPDASAFVQIIIFAETSVHWHFPAAHPCMQLFKNGRIWILSTANFKSLAHLPVKIYQHVKWKWFSPGKRSLLLLLRQCCAK